MEQDVEGMTHAAPSTLHHGSSIKLSGPTTDYLELRSCGDQEANRDENVGIQLLEIYVQ